MNESLSPPVPPDQSEGFDDMPSFVRAVFASGSPESLCHLDGWDVSPSGFDDLDWATGAHHADAAIECARRRKQPNFIEFVLFSMTTKIQYGGQIGPIERGFMQRLAQRAYAGAFH